MADTTPAYEVQVHRNRGMDESFEASTEAEAKRLAADELRDFDTRLVTIIDTETGRVIDELVQ